MLPTGRTPLTAFLKTQLSLDSSLNEILREAAKETEREILKLATRSGISATVNLSRLQLVLAGIQRIQTELWRDGVAETIADHIPEAQEDAQQAASVLDRYLVRVVGEHSARTLIDAFARQVELGLQLDLTRIKPELSLRVYRNAALSTGKIESIIRQEIIRGTSARQIANRVKPYIDPNVKGGVSYAAKRLGRTELNNAFHSAQVAEADRDWVKGVKWNLSKSHPKRDICNDYAEHKEDGLPVGVWAKTKVPSKPHPQCLCYMTYDMMEPDEALDLILSRTARAS